MMGKYDCIFAISVVFGVCFLIFRLSGCVKEYNALQHKQAIHKIDKTEDRVQTYLEAQPYLEHQRIEAERLNK